MGPTWELDSEIKTTCLYQKILSKLTEICWRWLSTTGSYSLHFHLVQVQNLRVFWFLNFIKNLVCNMKICVHYMNLTDQFFIGITTHTSITKLIYACPTTEVTTSCSKVVVIDKNWLYVQYLVNIIIWHEIMKDINKTIMFNF